MMPLSIRCFHSTANNSLAHRQFYILSKGNNAGKPGFEPWTNSYVATAPNAEMKEFYFWLTYGLYKAHSFKKFHRGSVIPFINIGETYEVIMSAAIIIYPKWQEYKTILQQMEQLENRRASLVQILKATATMQEYIIRNYLIKNGIKS